MDYEVIEYFVEWANGIKEYFNTEEEMIVYLKKQRGRGLHPSGYQLRRVVVEED